MASNRELYERYQKGFGGGIHGPIGKMSPDLTEREVSVLQSMDASEIVSPSRAQVSSAMEPQRDDNQLFPEIKGLKAVSHTQFIKLRDSYVNDTFFKRNQIQSADQGIEK